MVVVFNNGKTYPYDYSNVECLKDPKVLNPNMYRISREGREFFGIEQNQRVIVEHYVKNYV